MASINASTSGAGGVITTADATGILNLQTAGNNAVTIDTSQNVGIGTTSPAAKLQVSTSASSDIAIQLSNGLGSFKISNFSDSSIGLETTYSAPIRFFTNSSERWRIDTGGILSSRSAVSAGNFPFIIGTSGGYPVDRGININTSASSSIPVYFTVSSGAFAPGFISCTTTTTTYSTSSDYRLKENIETMTGALNTVCELNPVTFTWKSNGSNGQGFIAHELQAIVPDAVTGEKDAIDSEGKPQYQGVDSSFLVATLTAAIQEQQTIINDLKARIEVLEGASN